VSDDTHVADQGMASAFVGEELVRCNRCGLCLMACPTYRLSAVETDSARGRIALLEAMREGQLPLNAETANPFLECLACGACTETCLTSVDVNELVALVREEWYRIKVPPLDEQFVFNKLLARPRTLAFIMRALSSAKRSGLAEIARRLRLVRLVSPRLDTALGWVDTIPAYFLRDRLKRLGFRKRRHPAGKYWLRTFEVEPIAPGPQVLYFVGCASNFSQPDAAEAAIKVLIRAGCEVMIVSHYCCGFPAYVAGQREAARRLAALNVLALSRYSFDFVVSESAECSHFLKRYGELLDGNEEAERLAGTVRDFTELVAELRLPKGQTEERVTYHDPCHLGRGQGIREQPRHLLTEVAGAELVEMREANSCCGAGGFQSITQPAISQAVLQRKLEAIQETDADIVATACPLCMTQIAQGLRRAGSSIAVKHVAQVLADALEED